MKELGIFLVKIICIAFGIVLILNVFKTNYQNFINSENIQHCQQLGHQEDSDYRNSYGSGSLGGSEYVYTPSLNTCLYYAVRYPFYQSLNITYIDYTITDLYTNKILAYYDSDKGQVTDKSDFDYFTTLDLKYFPQ